MCGLTRLSCCRPAPAIAFIEMLIEQGVLHIAVRNRTEATIQPLLRFVSKQISKDLTSMPVLLEFLHAILSGSHNYCVQIEMHYNDTITSIYCYGMPQC